MHCSNVALTVKKCKMIFYTFDFLSTGSDDDDDDDEVMSDPIFFYINQKSNK